MGGNDRRRDSDNIARRQILCSLSRATRPDTCSRRRTAAGGFQYLIAATIVLEAPVHRRSDVHKWGFAHKSDVSAGLTSSLVIEPICFRS